MEAAHGILPHSFSLLFKSLAGVSTSGTSSHSPRNYDKAGAGESGRKKKKMNLMLLPSILHIEREEEVYPREGILDTVFFHIMCFPWNRSFKLF